MCAGCDVRRNEGRDPTCEEPGGCTGLQGFGFPPRYWGVGARAAEGVLGKAQGRSGLCQAWPKEAVGKRQWDAQIGDPLWGVSLLEQGQPSCWKQGDPEVKGWGPGTQVD